jgi:hypothetical protein
MTVKVKMESGEQLDRVYTVWQRGNPISMEQAIGPIQLKK